MAIEGSMCMTEVLADSANTANIPTQLKPYEGIRKERAEWARDQARINAMNEDVRLPTKGGFVMLKACHDYDESQNSRQKLEWMMQKQELEVTPRL